MRDDIAAVLRAELAAKQMTVEELAEASGISRSTILRLRSGRRDANMDQLSLIATALGTTPSHLILMAEDRAARRQADSNKITEKSTREVDGPPPAAVNVTAGSGSTEFDRLLLDRMVEIDNQPGLTKRQKAGLKSHARRQLLAKYPLTSELPKRKRAT